ncbi:MAG: galactokinase [Lachnospiraceae bacterium]|nr:galactokinase [Lachnospiraceae bacterium]
MQSKELIQAIKSGQMTKLFSDIYGEGKHQEYQVKRYTDAVERFVGFYGDGEISIFSAPGRTEIGGNHTDHQHGEVLAASINLDAIAIVKKTVDSVVRVRSDEYPEVAISLDNLSACADEKGTTLSLIKGVLAGFTENDLKIGGFHAYITSDVLIGSGLSSSAAFEVLIGTILSGLYNDMNVSPVLIARIGQYAENIYFGKPCGLMDQMACSVGGLVHIDFADPKEPLVEKVNFSLEEYGYSMCITDTKGSHADLTHEYAAVPGEMKAVAGFFGKEVLRDVPAEDILANIGTIRENAGDRAVLRALHFVNENKRVGKEVAALQADDMVGFLKTIKESGDSSYKYLQNVYSNSDVEHQNVSLALAVSEMFLGEDGVCRVHGGGFAGTIQAFVKSNMVDGYCRCMDEVFGDGACVAMQIRKYGGIQVV